MTNESELASYLSDYLQDLETVLRPPEAIGKKDGNQLLDWAVVFGIVMNMRRDFVIHEGEYDSEKYNQTVGRLTLICSDKLADGLMDLVDHEDLTRILALSSSKCDVQAVFPVIELEVIVIFNITYGKDKKLKKLKASIDFISVLSEVRQRFLNEFMMKESFSVVKHDLPRPIIEQPSDKPL